MDTKVIFNQLQRIAFEKKRPVKEVLQYYAMERFLYRLSVSPYKDSFFLKGGLMLMVWNPANHRATIDIDLLAKMPNTIPKVKKVIEEICRQQVEPDGVVFVSNSLQLTPAQVQAKYQGIAIALLARIFSAILSLRIDIGFNGRIFPCPSEITYPALLNFPAPILRGYTIETTIAEKFEAIVRLGSANTRMKDFYDIWLLLQQHSFDLKELESVIQKVLHRRNTKMDQMPRAFSPSFYTNPSKLKIWDAFIKGISREKLSLEKVILFLRKYFEFLYP